MTPELKPCPFCGGAVSMYPQGGVYCTPCGFIANIAVWNRRTPDLTEALARLKALEEEWRKEMRLAESNFYAKMGRQDLHHFGDLERWADEIAAIRKALGDGH